MAVGDATKGDLALGIDEDDEILDAVRREGSPLLPASDRLRVSCKWNRCLYQSDITLWSALNRKLNGHAGLILPYL